MEPGSSLEIVIAELRRIGKNAEADRLQQAADMTATTSSELLGEIGTVLWDNAALRSELGEDGRAAWDRVEESVNRAFPGPRPKADVLAGLLFGLVGAGAMVVAGDYPFGTAMRMGSGYFPTVLGGILVLFGAYLVWRGWRRPGPLARGWGWRPLALVTLSMLLFGFIVTRLGLVPALAVMLPVCALAGRDFRWREVLVLTAGMSAFAVALFVYGLKLPFRIFLDYW